MIQRTTSLSQLAHRLPDYFVKTVIFLICFLLKQILKKGCIPSERVSTPFPLWVHFVPRSRFMIGDRHPCHIDFLFFRIPLPFNFIGGYLGAKTGQ